VTAKGLKDDIFAYTELSAMQLCRYCSCTNSNITHYLKWKKVISQSTLPLINN